MGVEVAQELHGSTWQERYDWIMKVKTEGNEYFKRGIYD